MKSEEYLYDILDADPDGYVIRGKVFGLCTAKIRGEWKVAVCRWRYNDFSVVGEFFKEGTDAWEQFLKREYPAVLAKWQEHEDAAPAFAERAEKKL